MIGYVRFALILLKGDITLPFEAFVLPSLGPDIIMQLDSSIMNASSSVLDGSTEHLSFKTSHHHVEIKAPHRRVNVTAHLDNKETAQCSVASVNTTGN